MIQIAEPFSPAKTGVIVADAMKLQGYGLNAEQLSRLLSKHPSVDHVTINRDPLSPGRISEFVQSHRLDALVIGVGLDSNSTTFETAAVQAGVSRLSLAIVELVPFAAWWVEDSRENFTSRVANLLALHAAMMSACSLAKRAERTGVRLDKRMSRRAFFGSLAKGLGEESEKPIVLQELCSRYVSHCNYCINECKFDSITKGKKAVEIDDSKCVKCGACASVCPVGALQLPKATDTQIRHLFEASALDTTHRHTLLLTCGLGKNQLKNEIQRGERINHDTSLIELPCIAVLGWSHLIEALAMGVSLTLLCPSDSCPKRPAVVTTRKALNSINLVRKSASEPFAPMVYLEAPNGACLSALIEESSQEPRSLSLIAREFRQSLTRRHAISENLALIENHLPVEFRAENDEASMIFDLDVNEACTLCGACPTCCPEKALMMERYGDRESLNFIPANCVGCGICVAICPENSMGLRRAFERSLWKEGTKFQKFSDEVFPCARCGKPVATLKSILKVEGILASQSKLTVGTIRYCDDCKVSRLGPQNIQQTSA